MSDKMKWYIVHTYSGMENSAKNALIERVKRAELSDLFGEILVPTENVVETKNNKKRVVTRRLYSSYLFVQMVFNDETWHLVKNTPRITGFSLADHRISLLQFLKRKLKTSSKRCGR